ncbi:MAG: TIGR04282 family arsenosugar biosynthesis glycosyltransferase [Deferrisomatales bacterium]|nr:TIGR04282 family arsenosugar biosynthesis glycosyltransferase [Deferrisomatales bacterium]
MNTLLVFAKEPVPGRVKTRLAADIGDAAACRLYRAFLGDVAEHLTGLTAVAVTWWVDGAPGPVIAAAGSRWSPRWRVVPQPPGTLGERLEAAFGDAFARSPGPVGVIGSDCPHCDTGQLQALFAPLSDGADAVLLPAADGGYAGLAVRTPVPDLFHGIPWSSAAVAAATLGRLRGSGRRVSVLPPMFDVDTAAELAQLARLLREHPERAPHTSRVLAEGQLVEGG